MRNVEDILKIVQKFFNLKCEKSFYLHEESISIKKGFITADIFYSNSCRNGFDEPEIAISWNDKKKWEGGCYGILLKEDTEENIVKNMVSRVFDVEPKKNHTVVQTTIFDFI